MTFPDDNEKDEVFDEIDEQYMIDIGDAVLKLVEEAEVDGRVTVGVYPCAEVLERCPEQVMLCILPDSGPVHDVTIDIEHTLIEAHCLENDVRVLKVVNPNSLSQVLLKSKRTTVDGKCDDFSCILLQYPSHTSQDLNDWKLVEEFCNKMLYIDGSQSPSVQMPD